ncbi:MAG: oxaloacetate decarboxylase [Thermodesulfobacteriota bacterium]|nr:oxaloacetate decarboxylase [Thermodesulfobacteriota bacterium]
MHSKREEFRRLIAGPKILVMPSVFNGYSARLVERLGYKAAFITGGGTAENLLGWPDVGLMGLEENLTASRAMANCTNLPLLADADTGYGNAVNVFFAVQAFEQTGVAGVTIEDQVWPKRCGHLAGKEVIPAEEMVEKVKAAIEARRDPSFAIRARTDARAPLGLDEAIRRLNLYAEAGADLVYADALLSVEEIRTLARNVSKPLTVNMGYGIARRATTPLLSARQLQEMGVAVMGVPRLLPGAALRGMMKAMAVLAESLETGEVVERPDLTVSFEELHDLMGFPEIVALERRHLTESQLAAKYGTNR